MPPAHGLCCIYLELDPSMEGTEMLTYEILKRMGRVKASEELLPFRVAVKFADGNTYNGLLTVIKAEPANTNDPVVKIEFDDGDIEHYTQQDLYLEVAGDP